MIKSTVEKMADPIGFEIGASDDVTQSALLNGFCRGFSNSMTNDNNKYLQICHIVDKLDLNDLKKCNQIELYRTLKLLQELIQQHIVESEFRPLCNTGDCDTCTQDDCTFRGLV